MVVAACPANDPNTGSRATETLCAFATSFCPAGQVFYWFFSGPPGVANPTPGQWTLTGSRCLAAGSVPGTAIPVLTLADFRRLPLPPAKVVIEPGNGRTLVNVPTNVVADAPPVTLNTSLLGLPVRVRAKAVRFAWTFGDGARLDTADPGARYPDLRTVHTYLAPGTRSLGLTTSYTGEYSVAGGPWLPVDGVATVASQPVTLTVLETRAELVTT